MFKGILQNDFTEVSYYISLCDLSFEYLYVKEAELLILAQERSVFSTTQRLR
jgi:hypothetical protein